MVRLRLRVKLITIFYRPHCSPSNSSEDHKREDGYYRKSIRRDYEIIPRIRIC